MNESENQKLNETTEEKELTKENQEVVGNQEEQEPIEKVVFRHPQQILTNKQINLLLSKKEEDLDETEKSAIKLFLVRAKYHNSKPKELSSKQRSALKKKRRATKNSRKMNRRS